MSKAHTKYSCVWFSEIIFKHSFGANKNLWIKCSFSCNLCLWMLTIGWQNRGSRFWHGKWDANKRGMLYSGIQRSTIKIETYAIHYVGNRKNGVHIAMYFGSPYHKTARSWRLPQVLTSGLAVAKSVVMMSSMLCTSYAKRGYLYIALLYTRGSLLVKYCWRRPTKYHRLVEYCPP